MAADLDLLPDDFFDLYDEDEEPSYIRWPIDTTTDIGQGDLAREEGYQAHVDYALAMSQQPMSEEECKDT